MMCERCGESTAGNTWACIICGDVFCGDCFGPAEKPKLTCRECQEAPRAEERLDRLEAAFRELLRELDDEHAIPSEAIRSIEEVLRARAES